MARNKIALIGAGQIGGTLALLAALGYQGWYWHAGALHPLASFDAATMQVASPDPAVFAASDPYVFTFYAWPVERRVASLAAFA